MNDAKPEAVDFDESLYGRFESAWRRQAPQPIEDCLPPEDDPQYLPTLEELIKVDLDYHWRRTPAVADGAGDTPGESAAGSRPKVEEYIDRFPVIRQPEILLSLLHEEFLVRATWHKTPSTDEYRRRFPDLDIPAWTADDLEGETGIVATRRTSTAPGDALAGGAVPDGPLPIDFGKYVLLEEIGRGGMGLVYRAKQKRADRVVALKLVRRELLLPWAKESHTSALERFEHEVQATARLDHPNIVSVFDVGDMDREPFFSMQYVEGESLGEMLRDGPLDNRQAATYMDQVAQAVAYAHGEGILHRDLKPQNILVDKKTDKPLVADFGLAKLQENADELTKSGDFMGSPPYMSPEQATDPSRIGEQADVYSLGATLYHLLTGRTPFQATSITEMIEKIRHETPVPPRRRNVLIDRDLETICLKCLEKSVSHRYATAEILADELRRYLDNKPILARPVGPMGRIWRWSQRNPVTATSLALAVAGLLTALIAATVGYVRTSASLEAVTRAEMETSASLKAATKAKGESDESFRLARTAVDRLFTRVAEDDLLNQPGMDPLRRKLLEEAAGFYQQFLEQRKGDPAVRDELAEAHYRVGCIREHLGDDRAYEALDEARKLQLKLQQERPDDPHRLAALGDTLNRIGRVLTERGDYDDARSVYDESRGIRRRLARLAPDNVDSQRALANTVMNDGVKEMAIGAGKVDLLYVGENDDLAEEIKFRFDEARALLLQAREIRDKLMISVPEALSVRRDQAKGLFNLGNLEIRAGELAELAGGRSSPDPHFRSAEEYLESAIQEFEGLLDADRGNREDQYQLAICRCRLAVLKSNNNDMEAANNRFDEAQSQLKGLMDKNPTVDKYRGELGGVHVFKSDMFGRRGQLLEAVKELRVARELIEPLETTRRYRGSLTGALWELRSYLEDLRTSDPSNDGWKNELTEVEKRLNELGVIVENAPREDAP